MKKFMFQAFALLPVMSSLTISCGMENFTEFNELGGLRIVGVETSASEIDGTSSATASLTLTPYISDINAGGRAFNVSVVSCLDPSFAQTGELGCDSPNQETYPSFDTSTLAATSYTGAMTSVTINIVNPAALISDFSEQLRFNGVPYYVLFTITSGSESLSFIKQLKITDRGSLNQNPKISEVLLDGVALTTAPSVSGSLDVEVTSAGAPETYSELTSDGTIQTQTESYLVSWFASPGRVSPGRVLFGNKSKLETSLPTVLIAVIRDRRGGTHVKSFY